MRCNAVKEKDDSPMQDNPPLRLYLFIDKKENEIKTL